MFDCIRTISSSCMCVEESASGPEDQQYVGYSAALQLCPEKRASPTCIGRMAAAAVRKDTAGVQQQHITPNQNKVTPGLLASAALVLAVAVGVFQRQLYQLPGLQRWPVNWQDLQEALPAAVQHYVQEFPTIISMMKGISKQAKGPTANALLTKEDLSKYTGGKNPGDSTQIYIAILGQVFDVTNKPEFYGPGAGYACFAGTDGSKSFITGDFAGDVTDDVSSLDAEACLGLVGWLDFYHKTYKYRGKLIGRFYDDHGKATAELASVHARAKEGEAIKAAREKEEQNWPSCNTKWTQEEGGTVWCDGNMYPRKLFVSMRQGKSVWRCACFKELGWSDVRKVYADCAPDAHSCSTNAETEAADENQDPTVGIL